MSYKTLYVDIDDTLLMGDLSAYPDLPVISIDYVNGPIKVIPNQKNINLVVLFYKLGYQIIFWSRTGNDWAELAAKALNLTDYVDAYLTKPTFYLDDMDVEKWMGPRRWRAPV